MTTRIAFHVCRRTGNGLRSTATELEISKYGSSTQMAAAFTRYPVTDRPAWFELSGPQTETGLPPGTRMELHSSSAFLKENRRARCLNRRIEPSYLTYGHGRRIAIGWQGLGRRAQREGIEA